MMEIIRNNKGGEKLCLNGYMYLLNYARKSKLWWQCVEKKRYKCRSSISTDLGRENPRIGQPHNHPPDEAKIRVTKVKNFMKERAMYTEDNPVQIYSDGVRLLGLGEESSLCRLLPSPEACQRNIRRQRSSVVTVVEPQPQQQRRDELIGEMPNYSKMIKQEKTERTPNYGGLEKDPVLLEFFRTTGMMEQGTTKTENAASATMSFEDPPCQQTALSQPTAAKLLRKIGSQFEEDYFDNGEQKAVIHSVQSCLTDPVQMQVEPHLQTVPPLHATTQPVTKEKQIFIVADHQHCVMTSLASLWKSGKLCDAGIGNGSSTVMVHKLVLSAICPKLFSVFNTDIKSQEFLQVNFPREVSEEALNAFAEYMYNGVLDLDPDILEQMKIIAKRLDMTEFEQLCDSHLSNHFHQPASASFTNVPLIQTMQIPSMTSSSFGSTSFTQSTTPVIDNQPKISMSEVQKKPAAVFSQQSDVALLAPNKTEDAAGFVVKPSVKIEPVGPEDDQCGHWTANTCNQALTSTNKSSLSSTSITAVTFSSVPTSSTEFNISSSEATDFKSTRLKRKHSSKAPLISNSSPVKNIGFLSNSMNENFSKSIGLPSNTLTSADLPTSNNAIYPVSLVAANGNNLSLTTETADVMTVNSFMTREKT